MGVALAGRRDGSFLDNSDNPDRDMRIGNVKSACVELSKLRGSVGRITAYPGNCGLSSLSGSVAARSWKDQSTNQTIWSRRFTVEGRKLGTRSTTGTLLF
jgi:hypothetical protein